MNLSLPPDAPRPPPVPVPPGRARRLLERLLAPAFVVGGVVLLWRREWLSGLGVLLVVPGALDGALPAARRARAGSRRALVVALLSGLGVLLFAAGWLLGL